MKTNLLLLFLGSCQGTLFAQTTAKPATKLPIKKEVKVSQVTEAHPSNDEVLQVFYFVELMPKFVGGEKALNEYFDKSIKYPEQAKKNGTKGEVFTSFIIEKDGSISNVKLKIGIGDGCDEEALRVVAAMPKWTPGLHNGKPARVQKFVPVTFRIP